MHIDIMGLIQDEVRSVKRCLCVGGTAYLVQVAGVVALLLLALHAWNVYPGFYTTLAQEQKEGLDVWQQVCGSGTAQVVHSPLINCRQAQRDMDMNVRSKALEKTLLHLLEDFNVFPSLGCGQGSMCAYVLWKSVDTLFSYTLLLLTVVGLGLIWLLWSGHAAFIKPLRHLTMLRNQLDPKENPPPNLMHSTSSFSGSSGSQVPAPYVARSYFDESTVDYKHA